ncbi:MAG: methyltransferase domain-containing protein [Bryobacter sp.]|nr:methyltransferase domain-containing protein [Bryobacter sp.]
MQLRLLQHRVLSQELLPLASPADRRANLADIRRINSLTLARRRLLALLRQYLPPTAPFTFLDVGGASGDMAQAVQSAFPASRAFVLDLDPRNLQGASPRRFAADAFRLPLANSSCDVVHCSLFLHHFSNPDCVRLLVEMHRVARRLVLVQDLHRHPLSYHFLRATRPLLRWHPLTVHDGELSVAAAWRRPELASLLELSHLRPHAHISWHFPSFRYFIAIQKPNCD